MLMSIWFFFFIYLLAAVLSLSYVIRFLEHHGMVSLNYLQKKIPNSLGIYLWLMLLVYYALIHLWDRFFIPLPLIRETIAVGQEGDLFSFFFLAITVVFFLGWLDDSVGDKKVKGLSGHLRTWRKERIATTGLIKAAGIGGISLWSAFEIGNSLVFALMQALLLALMSNAVNLLDLRPGRAWKSFYLIALLMAFAGVFAIQFAYLFPIFVGGILLFPKDLRGQLMLGDAGANVLGFALGFCMINTTPWWFQTWMLALLLLVHWGAEHGSITVWIERNRLLNWFDRWGRA